MTLEAVQPWVVEVRCANRSHRPLVSALWQEVPHLPRELFDTSDAVGLRVEVLATDGEDALAYVQARITRLRGSGWVKGVDYNLSASPRRR
ncbi:MAG: hypothetical protein QOC92_3809 [Acidimicrobiaceae bacterium]